MSSSGNDATNYMKQGSTQEKGRGAQLNNIQAAKVIADLLKSSLGPRGLDKMLVDSIGQVTVTNDGATILQSLDIQHPAAKMLVEISQTTDNEVGDGTTSSVILTGAFVSNAEKLIEQNVHPTIIVDGYKKAEEKAKLLLKDITFPIETDKSLDVSILKKIAITSMQTKIVRGDAEHLADIVNEACDSVKEGDIKNGYKVNINNIKIEKVTGVPISSSRMVSGIVLDKEVVHSGMPEKVENARILLLNVSLEINKTETQGHITMDDPKKMKAFIEEEDNMLEEMVEKIKGVRANVVFCQKGIDDRVQDYLASAGILAVRRIKESDLTKLMKATGGRVVTNIKTIANEDLGNADVVEQRLVEPDNWVFVEGCKNSKAVTLLLGGASSRIVDEVERSVHDALMVTKDVMEEPFFVAGGGSPEAYLATELEKYATEFSGREQLAIREYARALEVIPLTIAENAGMDPIDTITQLRAEHSRGNKLIGVDAKKQKVTNMKDIDVIEPLSVKEHIITNASEAAYMLLRIDEILIIPGAAPSGKSDPHFG